jgi:Membrane domain of glycerophosphoryl diester phosphodiesterase
MNEPMRPMTLGEILDRTVQLYRRNFLLFAGSAAPPSAVMVAMLLAIGAVVGFFARMGAGGLQTHGIEIAIVVIAVAAVTVPAEIAATVVSHAALVRAGISAHLGQKLRMREAIRSVWPRFWRYLGLLFLQALFVGVIPGVIAGGLFGLVFALAFAARANGLAGGAAVGICSFLIFVAAAVAIVELMLTFSLAMPACVAEEKPAWEAMKRSMKLSKRTRGRIFLMLLLIWALSMVVLMMAYIPMMIVGVAVSAMGHGAQYATAVFVISEIVNVLVNFAIQVLVTPVYATALVLFYFDQRIRTEGYDIEWMMAQAGLQGAAASAGSGTPALRTAGEAGAGNA